MRQLASELQMINFPTQKSPPCVIVALANTEGSQRLHHRLRYQVYCQELGYEDPARFPDGEERDHYDNNAVRFVAYDERCQDWVGTLRLVPPGPAGLPLISMTSLTSNVMQLVERQQVAEVSRMCVRTRTGGSGDRMPRTRDGAAFRESALVFFALIRASVDYAFSHGIGHLAFLTTLSLSRLLGRVGISDRPAGDSCQHRGLRYPRIADVAALYHSLIEAGGSHPFSAKLSRQPYLPYSALPATLFTGPALMACG
jgi:N-acyl amino acid synthase of PEP-CTERM/exosortase system